MSRCESHEMAVSALLDDELPREERLPVLDHLVACEACRAFFRSARTLDDALLEARAPRLAGAAPDAVWERIRRRLDDGAAGPSRRERAWPRLVSAAALIVVGVAIGALLRQGAPAPEPVTAEARRPPAASAPGPGYVEVLLEGNRGGMTEARFVALMTEVLEADRAYHRKMLEVMARVTEPTAGREGPDEGPWTAERERERGPERALRRVPGLPPATGDRL